MKNGRKYKPLVYMLAFGAIGSIILRFSFAATSNSSIEPETGTLSSSVVIGADPSASNGSYITFSPNASLPPAATGAQRPFSNNSPFNTAIPATTRWFDQNLLHTISPSVNNDTRRHWYVLAPFGLYFGKSSDPVWTLNFPDYIASDWNRNRPAQSFQVHAPADLAPGIDTDKVMIIINGTTYYESWNTTVNASNHTVTAVGWATGDVVNGPGAGTLSNNDGTRAANFSWMAGLITGHDISSGKIDHALAIAMPQDMLEGHIFKDYIAPATAFDNGGAQGPFIMGTRLGVPAAVTRPNGLSQIGVEMFDALQKYGAYVGDFVGGAWPAFYADKFSVSSAQTDPLYAYWNNNGSADMDKIGPLLRVANYQP
jgi:hypothetical protein